MKLKDILTESKYPNDQIYMLDNTLWYSYAPGSGNIRQMTNFRSYITDKHGDKNYDYIGIQIAKWSKTAKPIQKNTKDGKDKKLFKIPVYKRSSMSNEQQFSELDIWGGNIKPVKYVWMVTINEQDYTLISLFDKRNEANYWLKESINDVLKEESEYPIKYTLLKQYPGIEYKPGTIFIKKSKGSSWMTGNHSSTEWNEKYFNSIPGFFKKIK